MEKTVTEAIQYRRSARVYKEEPIDFDKVKKCLINASLAPTSSNLQLWEFYHVTNKDVLKQISKACLNQNAAKTANQLVVVVARQDLWKTRAKSNIEFLKKIYSKENLSKRDEKRKKMAISYYSKLIPAVYSDFFGIFGIFYMY